VHSGTLDFGHYWTYGKDSSGHWYKYDDMQTAVPDVTNSINNILSSGLDGSGTPYILLYKLVSPNEQLQQNLTQLKSSVQELKNKLQAVHGKLEKLKEKLGKK
jgi:hypothetical protein